MNNRLCFTYRFYPVGQGLFSSGALYTRDASSPSYLWVYDCGTVSEASLIDNGIQLLQSDIEGRRQIDLLVLSHFDHDHISGVTRLLSKFKVHTLMLPYMELPERLIIAFEENNGDPEDPLTAFYIDPVSYLFSQGAQGIDQIVFVPPSGEEGPGYTYPPDSQDLRPDAEPLIPFGPVDASKSDMRFWEKNDKPVRFMQNDAKITLFGGYWEIIPYNQKLEFEVTGPFTDQVNRERDNLLSADSESIRKNSLAKLKKSYNEHFGKSSKARNQISLFLYSGPLYSNRNICGLVAEPPFLLRPRRWPDPMLFDFLEHWLMVHPVAQGKPFRDKGSILYTGDGYLDTDLRRNRLISYLKQQRIQKIGIFQVMHHGAEDNWKEGTAAAISPTYSIFCSDPKHKKYKHPHKPVFNDFWNYGAKQVDKKTDFVAFGILSS